MFYCIHSNFCEVYILRMASQKDFCVVGFVVLFCRNITTFILIVQVCTYLILYFMSLHTLNARSQQLACLFRRQVPNILVYSGLPQILLKFFHHSSLPSACRLPHVLYHVH